MCGPFVLSVRTILDRMKWLALAVVLSACGGKSEQAADTKSPCESAINRGVDMTLEKRMARGPMAKSPEAKKLVDELAPKLKTTLTELCVTDQWPETVVSCFQTATDIATCKDGLKPEQRQKYTQEMMKVMMAGRAMAGSGMRGHGSALPPEMVPPTGSASASGGSGSAN